MAVHAQHPQQAHTSTGSGRAIRAILSALLTMTAVMTFVIALIAGGLIVYGLYHGDQVYPGVNAAGVDVGGMTASEAHAAIDARTTAYAQSELTFVHDGQTFTTTPAELGIRFDTDRTTELAHEFGRSGNWWADSRDWVTSLVGSHEVSASPVIDSARLEAYFQSIAPEVGTSPREPSFQISDSGQFEIIPASTGLGIDASQTSRDLAVELRSLGAGPVEISSIEVEPAFTEEHLDPLGQRVSGIVSEDFILERGDYQWALDARRLDSLLDVSFDYATGETSIDVDRERLANQIRGLADSAYSDGRDARIRWDGDSWEVRPAEDGWRIDVDTAVDVVAEAIISGEHRAALPVTEYPASISTQTAEEAAEFGNALTSSAFRLTWDEGETELGGSVIAAAIEFVHDSDAGTIEPEVSTNDLALFLTSITNEVEIRPVNADLRYLNGEVVVRSEEEYGLEMDLDASAEAIAAAIDAGESSAEIIVNEAVPEVTADMAGDIEIREMLSYGETYYGGSAANRAHNVEFGTQLANGALVPPGGIYSFNDSIGGEITEAAGFMPGFGIEGATDGGVTTVPMVGGGICQVSTTVFQAAFWSGVEIVERSWHMYWMPLYGNNPTGMTGLDATIATSAGLDFKFRNTTDDWIAIVASANGSANRFEIWGTDPGWTVETSGPHITNRVSASGETVIEETDQLPAGYRSQVETAHDGFDVRIDRTVYDSDGDLIDDLTLHSTYRPASNRVIVGTGN